jgi:hypothetical protein
MPNVGFNLDKFIRRIERQRVVEPGDVELLVVLLTGALAREKRLRAACEEVLAIAENRRPGHWDDVMFLMRAALAGEEEQPT